MGSNGYTRRDVWFLVFILISLTLTIPGFRQAATAAEKTIVLRFGSSYPPPPNLFAVGVDWWQREVEKRTNGRVKFQNHWGGAVFGPSEVLDALEKRMTDIVQYAYVYVPGKTPLGNFTVAIPFRPTGALSNLKITRQIFDEFPAFDKELARYNGKVLFLQAIMNYDVSSSTPIRTLDDFKGKKLAVIGLWFPEYTTASGATPVTMPAPPRYEAFERKVLDGQILTLDLMDTFKHYEVQKNFTFVPLGSIVAVAPAINLNCWNALPPDIQQVLLKTGREAEIWHADLLDKKRDEIIGQWKAHGVAFHTLPQADVDRWAKMMPDTAAGFCREVEAKGFPGWQIMDRYIQLSEQYGHKWPRKFAVR